MKREYIEVFSSKGLRENAPTTLIQNDQLSGGNEFVVREFVIGKAPGNVPYANTDDTPLTGMVLGIHNFHRLDTDTKALLVHTASNVYKLNTTTILFECLTDGVVVEDCETQWTDGSGGDVTPTADTSYYRKGSKSTKLDVKDDAGVELLAYSNDPSALDISDYTYIHFYVRCSVVLTEGDLAVVMDDSANCASPIEDIDIPAITSVNTWVECQVAIPTPASYGAIESVGVKQKVDKGAIVIYIDDIRAIVPYTGDADEWIGSVALPDSSGNWLYIYSLPSNGLKKWDGSGDSVENLTGWTSYKAKDVFELATRLIGIHTYEGSAWQGTRVRYSKTGDPEDTTHVSAGFTDLPTETKGGELLRGAKLGDVAILYSTRSIITMRYTGEVKDPYSYETSVPNVEFVAPGGLLPFKDVHYVFLKSGLYVYTGGATLEPFDAGVREQILRDMNWTHAKRAFFSYDSLSKEIRFYYPSGTNAYPNKYYCYNLDYKTWSKGRRSFLKWGKWVSTAFTIESMHDDIDNYTQPIDSLTGGDVITILMGDEDGKLWQENSGWNHKGSAQNSWVETKDFVVDKYGIQGACWMDANFEAKGNGTLDVSYSLDFGATWSPSEVVTLTAVWMSYNVDFEETAKYCRLKFRNSNSNESYYIRFYNIGHLKLSGRGWA